MTEWVLNHQIHGTKPWAVQAAAQDAREKSDRRKYGYWLEQGLGKTPLTLNDFILSDSPLAVVVCPNSFKRDWTLAPAEWGMETIKASSHCDWVDERISFCFRDQWKTLWVFNYEAVRRGFSLFGKLLDAIYKCKAPFVVIDESSAIKNPDSETFASVLELCKRAKHVRLLNGTPQTQSVMDWYPQLRCLGEFNGYTTTQFRAHFAVKGGYQGRQIVGVKNEEELHPIIQRCSFRALKTDWRPELPPQTDVPVHLAMTPQQTVHYDEMMNEFFTIVDGLDVPAKMVLTQMDKLRQISSCVAMHKGEIRSIGKEKDNPKLRAVHDIIENGQGKVIVVYTYRASGEALMTSQKKYHPAWLRGGMKPDDIMSEKSYFNDNPECRVLTAQESAACMGHTLLGGEGLIGAALGLALSPAVSGVTLAWALIVASAAAATWAVLRTRHEADAPTLGRLIESAAGGRAGSIVGVVSPTAGKGTGSSPALLVAADTRAAAVVSFAAPGVSSAMRRTTLRRMSYGAGAALTGGLLFLAGSPASGRAAAFWHPLRTWREARAPVRLVVDQRTVRRGGSVTATVTVPGAVRATLWTRGPGEPWKPMLLALDPDGHVVQHVGPIESDLYLRASSGGRRSAEVKIDVALPAFLADLGLTARFPSYLGRADEPLLVGPDLIPLPAGTTILTNGTASVPLASAAWTLDSRVEQLRVVGPRIDGRFTPAASGTWRMRALSADGSALEGVAPELHLLIVPDSAPVVTLPVPSRDTTLPISLHQPLVVDVRDDHGISRLSVVSWRVSRTGRVFDAVRESLDVSGVGDRAIVQGRLDAERRGLLPGDTLRLYVEALDNAPAPHAGRSAEIALRLPSMEELRAQAREAARSVSQAADSVSAAQRELSDRTRDLAQERSRDQDGRTAGRPDGRAGSQQNGTMSFQSTQKAEEIARDQAAMSQRVQRLRVLLHLLAR